MLDMQNNLIYLRPQQAVTQTAFLESGEAEILLSIAKREFCGAQRERCDLLPF